MATVCNEQLKEQQCWGLVVSNYKKMCIPNSFRRIVLLPIKKYISKILNEQRIFDNQIIQYYRLSLIINKIISFLGHEWITISRKFNRYT